MEVELAIKIVQELIAPGYLNSVQEMVFREAWGGKSYPQIARDVGYDQNYIRGIGAQVWRMLGNQTQKRVNKSNFRKIIEGIKIDLPNDSKLLQLQIDWGEAIDVSVFYGREAQRAEIAKWLLVDRCQTIAILGMGGMGKTTLAIKIVQELQPNAEIVELAQQQFSCILWRSLLNAPRLDELLPELIHTLVDSFGLDLNSTRSSVIGNKNLRNPDRIDPRIPQQVAHQIELLVEICQQYRCLLVLDNYESILQSGAEVGEYRVGYGNYGGLVTTLGRVNHQSCLVITSREKPTEISRMEGVNGKVRTLMLAGLDPVSGQQIFVDRGCLPIEMSEWLEIDRYYGGNPLAFQLVAAAVKDIADGDVREILPHLRSAQLSFSDIQMLLSQQWERLTPGERQVMYWLAIAREPISLVELTAALHPNWDRQTAGNALGSSLLSVLQSLRRRSIITLVRSGEVRKWSLQPVVMEYVTGKFLTQICTEIEIQQPLLLNTHALIQADNREYIRQIQIRLILEPIGERLRSSIGFPLKIGTDLRRILADWRNHRPLYPGYLAGNILNFLIQLKLDLTDLDCSELAIQQAYLVGVELHGVNFARSQMVNCAFTQTFGSILSIAYSPDGKTFAASDTNGEIRIWSAVDSQYLLTCGGHTNWVRELKFSPNGRYLASSSDDWTIAIWDLATGTCSQTLAVGIQSFGLSFSPDSRYLASGSNGSIYYWDILTGDCVQQFPGDGDRLMQVAIHPSGDRLVSGSANGKIQVWDIATGKSLFASSDRQSQTQENGVTAVNYSPDGKNIISSYLDGSLRLWDTAEENFGDPAIVPTDGNSILTAIFSPDGQYFASGGLDGVVRIWRTIDRQCLHRLTGHTQRVWSIAFHPNGNWLIGGGEDRTIRTWQVSDGRCLQVMSGYTNWMHSIAWSPDSRQLITASCDALIRLWDLDSPHCLERLSGHLQPTFAVAFDPQGQTFASGGDDRTIRIWDAVTLSLRHILYGHSAKISSLVYSLDGKYLASGGIDCNVRIWDLRQGRCASVLYGHTDRLYDLVYHPNGDFLASASADGTIRIWNFADRNCSQTIVQQSNCQAVAFAPTAPILASAIDSSIQLWQTETAELCGTLTGHQGAILTLAYSLDGRSLISGASDHTIKIWSVETRLCTNTLYGHQGWVLAIAISSCGRFLASASQDETIRLWDLATGNLLSTRRPLRPYEGMNITGIQGLSSAQLDGLKILGAIEPA